MTKILLPLIVFGMAMVSCRKGREPLAGADASSNDGSVQDAATSSDRLDANEADAVLDGASGDVPEVSCDPSTHPGGCPTVMRCTACDAGLCGAISHMGGCDQEGQDCDPDCGGPSCTCTNGLWSCPMPTEGTMCNMPGRGCAYPVGVFGGGVTYRYCCPGRDGGAATWNQECPR